MSGAGIPAGIGAGPGGSFYAKTAADVLSDIAANLTGPDGVDPSLDLSEREALGITARIISSQISELWAITEELYNSLDPNDPACSDFLLDAVSSISGTKRQNTTYGLCVCNLSLAANTTINVGTISNVSGSPGNTWTLLGPGAAVNDYTPGPVSSGSSPATISSVWRCTSPGPVQAVAGALTVIASPPNGFISLNNPADAVEGMSRQDDAALRVTRLLELSAGGSGTLDALRADVLEVPGVLACYVFENSSGVADSSGRVPHSCEVVIWDGVSPAASNDAVSQAIWDSLSAGTALWSSTGDSGTATDSQGTHNVVFSRAQPVNFYLTLTVKTSPSFDVVGGPAAVKGALARFGLDNYTLGSTVYALPLQSCILAQAGSASPYSVPGVVDVTVFELGVSPSPSGTSNLTFGTRQLPFIETTNISLTVT